MKRILFTITAAVSALMLAVLLLSAPVTASQQQDQPAIPQTTPAPTPKPTFSATMSVMPSQNLVNISDTMTVTIDIDISTGCVFPVLDFTLSQIGNDDAIFAYTSPPTDVIGSPGNPPYTYILTAISTGTVTFKGQAYGERNCGDYWNWAYVNGYSPLVRIGAWPHHQYLPAITNTSAP